MAASSGKRVAYEGFGFGLIAGVIYLGVEMLDAARTGWPGTPLRQAASLVLGFDVLDSTLGTTFLIGLAVHLVLSGFFGLVYAEIESRLPEDARRRYGVQVAIGIAYAAFVWLVNIEMISPKLFPWLVTAAPMKRLVLQALFYGAPLAAMFVAAERRTPQIIRPSVG